MSEFADKFHLSVDENIFLAKRNIIDNIYKSARLEGIAVTYAQTAAIYEGAKIYGLALSDVVAINNLKHAWRFLLETITYPRIDFAYICEINRQIGTHLFAQAGYLRKMNVKISGSKYHPPLPERSKIEQDLASLERFSPSERAIETMLYLMRTQAFLDGNKRTATLCANKILISAGAGLININEEDLEEFRELLVGFYESNDTKKIKRFLYDNAIDGCEIAPLSESEKAELEANQKMFEAYKNQNIYKDNE